MERQTNQNESERWENYRLANSRFPHIRQIELLKQLELTNPQNAETIVEVGTGNGYLTFELAKEVGQNGRILTYDYQESNIDFVEKVNNDRFPITAIHQSLDYKLEVPNDSVDRISTIATLHHYDDRSMNTGTNGRQRALDEFYRVLREGGTLVVGDVAHGTAPQRYFDAIDNPVHCHPRGHPHDFLDERIARELCEEAGFKDVKFEIERVPWIFDDEEQAKEFLHTIHNAKCSPEESLEIAKQHTPYSEVGRRKQIGWELFYLTAKK
jgi:SAM-dependent methyltransferase|tara:strand:+ start:1162 stop:1965 length:804 start_codon:yes stop_codon:yes gene_type:complete